MKNLQRVTVYASLGLRQGISELLWAFRKKHTLEEFPVYLDDHPFQIHERIRQEMKNGMRTADIVLLPHYMALQMKNEGLLTPYDPKDLDAYPEKFYDKEKNWFAAGVTFMGMAYNSRRLRPKDLPESLDDISSERWKNRLGMQSLTASKAGNLGAHYVAFLRRWAGEKKWFSFLKSLGGPNKPKTFDCIDHLLQGLIDGNHELALTVYSLAYFREKNAGSPVASFELGDAPRMLTFTSAGLLRTARDNSSAKRFLDFMLSEEAQRIIGTISGISPARPDVRASYSFEVQYDSSSAFYPGETDLKAMPAIMKTFRSMDIP
jgi:ABC-type Fe3+ transport system substrate-binding protein